MEQNYQNSLNITAKVFPVREPRENLLAFASLNLGNGFAVQGSVGVSGANPEVQKVVIPKVSGEGTVYLYATGAVTIDKLAWSEDVLAGNKVLETPKPTVEPVTVQEGEAADVTITWGAIDNAATYQDRKSVV